MIKEYLERYKNNVLQLGMMLKDRKIFEVECIEAASMPCMTVSGMPKSGTKQDLSDIIHRYRDILKHEYDTIDRMQDEITHVQILMNALEEMERFVIECYYWHYLGADRTAKRIKRRYRIEMHPQTVYRMHKEIIRKLEAQEAKICNPV